MARTPSILVVALLLPACARVGYLTGDLPAASGDRPGPVDGQRDSKLTLEAASRDANQAREAGKADGKKLPDLRRDGARDGRKADLPRDLRPLDRPPSPGGDLAGQVAVSVTAANDSCGTQAVADFSGLAQSGTVKMNINTTGAKLDHGPGFYCSGMVDVVVRVLNNAAPAKYQCQGASGDIVVMGPLAASPTCPSFGWTTTTNCSTYPVSNLAVGSSSLIICAAANQSFSLTWSKL